MHKITQKAVEAFFLHKSFKQGNTEVHTKKHKALCETYTITILYLNGNPIAKITETRGDNKVFIKDAGWQSGTTKERLNGVLQKFNKKIVQRNSVWIIQSFSFSESGDLVSEELFLPTYQWYQVE